jgi:hypothetical protein
MLAARNEEHMNNNGQNARQNNISICGGQRNGGAL